MAWHHRLLNVFRSDRLSDEIEREMAFHLAERVDELRAQGYGEREARDEARRRFGNHGIQHERTREANLATWLESVAGDARYALRALKRSPVFALAAVGSIALGIGATVVIYALIDAVSLRALSVPHPEELIQLGAAHAGDGGFVGVKPTDQRFSNPLWEVVRDSPNGFTSVAAFGHFRANLNDEGEARYIVGAYVSGDYFRMFGVTPAAGRLISTPDDVRGCAPVLVLSYQYWSNELARDPGAIGRWLSLDGKPFQIVGVAEDGFTGPVVGIMPRIFAPLCAEVVLRGPRSRLDARSDWWLNIIGRRPAGVDPRQVAARLAALAPGAYGATLQQNAGTAQRQRYLTNTFSLGDASRGLSELHSRFGRALLTLMVFVVVVMLIACVNVANLLLARAEARRRELAVRLALGAARGRLARQLLTESALLAVLGAAGGLLLAQWGALALVSMIAMPSGPAELDLSLSWRLVGFTTLVAGATALLFGVLPAWRGTRVAPQATMNASGRALAEGHSRFTLGKALVGAQVALSLVLLVGAGLLVGSLRKLATEDTGFRPDGVLVARANLQRAGLPKDHLGRAGAELLTALRALPGVVEGSQSRLLPVSRDRWNNVIAVEGYTPKDPDDAQIWFNRVSPRFFATLGTRLLAGRDFEPKDVAASTGRAIVNEAFGRRFFGTPNVVGRQFSVWRGGDSMSPPIPIVGVVENAKYESLREDPVPIAYLAMNEGDAGAEVTIALRTTGDPTALVPAVRLAVARMNPRILLELETLSNQVASSLSRERLLAMLSAVFGGVALVLATLGVYGVMSYSVARRTNEIGVRQALGAGQGRIIRMVVSDISRTVLAGAIVGAVVAVWAGRFLSKLLYRMEPTEPLVFVAAAGTLALAALAAGFIPALKASRVDPVTALRE